MNRDEALAIANNFQTYLRNGDKSFIEKYSKEQIKCALSLISHSDSSHQWYKEMERRIMNLDELSRENKWHNSYFLEKVLPIVLTGIITGIVSFMVGFSLRLLEVRDLKQEIQNLKSKEYSIESEIKDAVKSGDPSKIISVFDKLNRQK